MQKPKTWKRRDTRLRFEQFASHPKCDANVTSAVLGIPMHIVAERESPGAGKFGQSPFALAQGVTFEKSLFEKDAERLREGLAQAGVLQSEEATFIDLRLRMNGGKSVLSLDDAAARTTETLQRVAAKAIALPLVVAGAAFELPGEPVLLPEAMLAIDALVIREMNGMAELVVGEVKTYPDRAGFTDRGQLAGARAQAGVYAHALKVALETLGLRDRIAISDSGFLVLARPGTSFPRVRADEEVRYQAYRGERGFGQLRDAARALQTKIAEPPSDLEADAVLEAGTCYRASCVSFCERAERCHEAAFRGGDPAVLGDDAKRFLGAIDLFRAAELLGGAKPANLAEESLVARARALEGIAS